MPKWLIKELAIVGLNKENNNNVLSSLPSLSLGALY